MRDGLRWVEQWLRSVLLTRADVSERWDETSVPSVSLERFELCRSVCRAGQLASTTRETPVRTDPKLAEILAGNSLKTVSSISFWRRASLSDRTCRLGASSQP